VLAPDAFDPVPGYLDTATVGLPPRATVAAVRAALDAWQTGAASARGFDADVERARAAFARLVHADVADVAVGAQVSAFAGVVAAALPAGARVLTAEGDFTSVLFPFLAQEARGVRVRAVPVGAIAEAIEARDALVAVSAVQSADGAVADLGALASAADHHGVPVFLDATQACGWLDVDARRFAYVAAAAYKWLLAPRGAALCTFAPGHRDALVPHGAGWYAGEDRWSSLYGGPLRLAGDARRFDLSPAWLCWAGAAPALELVAGLGAPAIGAHDLALAARLRAGLGLPPGDSPIVAVGVPGAEERLRAAGVRAAVRAGRLRASFHLTCGEADVDLALEALAGAPVAG
jgi:selenocysteine lyase/cysteine desulfurase